MTLGRKQNPKDGHLSQVCNKPGPEPGLSLAGEGSLGASEVSWERGLRGQGGPGVGNWPGSRPSQKGATASSSSGPCPRTSQTPAHLSLEGKSVGTKKVPMSCMKRLLASLTSKQTLRDRGGMNEDLGISRYTLLSIKQINSQDQLHSMSTIV